MLTTVESVLLIPGMSNLASLPTAWLNSLVGAADSAIKSYLKRDLELKAYEEYYDGSSQRDVICRQYPLLAAQTTVAAGSNGAVLPIATLNVATTDGFHPGIGSDPALPSPTISVQTGVSTWTTITYTGTTATSFTGCTGGTGTLVTGYRVSTPVVFFDPGGYYGQPTNAFSAGTQLVMGNQFVVVRDSGGKVSNRGLIRRIGGAGAGFIGFFPENFYSGKLGAYRLPVWPKGDGSIKVLYSAGYKPLEIPYDLKLACDMLVAQIARIAPTGGTNLSSESLGGYSYNLLVSGDNPEIGELRRILSRYRETSW